MRTFNIVDENGGIYDPAIDWYPMFQSAYAKAVAAKVGEIVFPAEGKYRFVAGGIRIKDKGISIRGEFPGCSGGYTFYDDNNDDGVVIDYQASVGGIAVYVAPEDSATLPIYGNRVSDLRVRGNGIAAVGIRYGSVANGGGERLYASGCTSAAFDTVANNTAPVTWNYENYFEQVYLKAMDNGYGLLLAGTWSQSNAGGRASAFGTFNRIHVTHKNKAAIYFASCDDMMIIGAGCSRIAGGTGETILFGGGDTTTYRASVGNTVLGITGSAKLIRAYGGTYPARSNFVLCTGVDGQMTVDDLTSDGQGVWVINQGGQLGINGFTKLPATV